MSTEIFIDQILPTYYFKDPYFARIVENNKPVWKTLENLTEILADVKVNLDGSYVARTAKVHPTAIIRNSVVLEDCNIGEFTTIRDSIIAPHCIVGHCSEIARSIVMSKSAITHFCFVGDSIIGSEVLLGGGIRTANRRLDKKEIVVKILGQMVVTGKSFLGAIIGDRCRLGGGVHPNPGTLIGQGVLVMPRVELYGFVPSFTYVKMAAYPDILKLVNQEENFVLEVSDPSIDDY